jgi:mono/diheme cytochrome c family protein
MKALVSLLLLLGLAACDESMDNQNRLKTYGSSRGTTSWPSEGEALPLVKGTVAQGTLEYEREAKEPPSVSIALLQRGRQRYDIYCSVCHGFTGGGDGVVVAHGFPKPRPFTDPDVMRDSGKQLVEIIGNGAGAMYGFYDRVGPKDRWAIAAYIRALQLAATGRKPQS